VSLSAPSRPFWGVVAIGLGVWSAAALGVRQDAGATAARTAGSDLDDARRAAELFARLVAHAQGSGGDPRFTERMRASPDLVEEVLASAAYARHLGRVEEPRLVRAEPRSAERMGPTAVKIGQREYWTTRVISVSGGVLETRSDVVDVEYVLRSQPGGWTVVAWDLAPAAGGGGVR
jgi:hypothetical protein